MAGCDDNNASQRPTASTVGNCEYSPNVEAPEWYCLQDVEGYITAIGIAKPNLDNDQNMQREMAMANAREKLAIKTLQETLEGSRQLERWVAPNGDLILLVGVPIQQ